MNKQLVLQNIKSVDVGVNEILHRFSFNRNINKLLSNDIALSSLYKNYLDSMNIFEYNKNHIYRQNDLVWVKRSKGDFKLFLVRCVIDENNSDLQNIVDSVYIENVDEQLNPEFDKYGWKDENFYLNINEYDVESKLRRYFIQQFNVHEKDKSYHKFGSLSNNEAEINKKLLLADLSNADKNRETIFYPYYTHKIEPDNTILYGYYRVWDSGTLEIDLVYRLGYKGQIESDGYITEVIECNNYSMKNIQHMNSEMSKYFNTTKDRDIFVSNTDFKSQFDDIQQINRNDYVNTYTAEIKFPKFYFNGKSIILYDNQYMIFGSDVLSQDANKINAQIEPGANCITYYNKTKSGFTSLYITYPDKNHFSDIGYNATNGGLVSNSFHCHIIGRWMEEPIQI